MLWMLLMSLMYFEVVTLLFLQLAKHSSAAPVKVQMNHPFIIHYTHIFSLTLEPCFHC